MVKITEKRRLFLEGLAVQLGVKVGDEPVNAYASGVLSEALKKHSVNALAEMGGVYAKFVYILLTDFGLKPSDFAHFRRSEEQQERYEMHKQYKETRNRSEFRHLQKMYASGLTIDEIVVKTGRKKYRVQQAVHGINKDRVCYECSAKFEAAQMLQVCCSNPCYQRHRAREQGTARIGDRTTCNECGKSFETTGPVHKYCSKRCRNRVYGRKSNAQRNGQTQSVG